MESSVSQVCYYQMDALIRVISWIALLFLLNVRHFFSKLLDLTPGTVSALLPSGVNDLFAPAGAHCWRAARAPKRALRRAARASSVIC